VYSFAIKDATARRAKRTNENCAKCFSKQWKKNNHFVFLSQTFPRSFPLPAIYLCREGIRFFDNSLDNWRTKSLIKSKSTYRKTCDSNFLLSVRLDRRLASLTIYVLERSRVMFVVSKMLVTKDCAMKITFKDV